MRPGDTLLLDDGRIVLGVSSVKGPRITTVVEQGGLLSNNKGINRKGGGLTAPALTEKDMQDIKIAAELKADFLGVSFPRSGADIRWARDLHAQGRRPRPDRSRRSSAPRRFPRWTKSSTPPTPSWWRAAISRWRSATPWCRRCRSA